MEDLVIWGAGAIGGTIGAALARAGKNPLLVDAAADHIAAMNAKGLKITGPIEDLRDAGARRFAGSGARAAAARDACGEKPAHGGGRAHDRAAARG